MPESDPAPEALISRLERLERLAGLEGGVVGGPTVPAEAVVDGGDPREQPVRSAPSAKVSDADRVRSGGAPVDEQASADTPATTPPSTGKVDVDMLRRSWPTLVERLKNERQMVLFSYMQSVTPASYDGEVLELAFPPGQSFGVEKVEQREDKLREVLQALFGVSPKIRCVVRQAAAGGVTVIEDDDDAAPDESAALERLKAELNAEVATDGDL